MTMAIIIGCGLSLFIVIGPMFHVPMKGSLPLFFFLRHFICFPYGHRHIFCLH